MNFQDFASSIIKTDIKKIKETTQPKPFVKWVGGKRSIINELVKRMPTNFNNYYEPFCGGGALFFEIYNMAKGKCFLSDMNADLIIAYNVIKNNPKELIEALKIHKENHCEEYYYKMRELQDLQDPVQNSARFIYLMKTCFNGLYRVNKNNQFNVPIGSYKNPNICDETNIYAVHEALQSVEIKYQDFSKITPQAGDFVYFDPPYQPIKPDSFTKYLSGGFDEKQQERLRDFALELKNKGVLVMISNSNADLIFDLYNKDFKIETVPAPRVVSCKASGRESVMETVVLGF